jgi:hypothetical protein
MMTGKIHFQWIFIRIEFRSIINLYHHYLIIKRCCDRHFPWTKPLFNVRGFPLGSVNYQKPLGPSLAIEKIPLRIA